MYSQSTLAFGLILFTTYAASHGVVLGVMADDV